MWGATGTGKTRSIMERHGFPNVYPLELPCRYANRVACYTAVYVVSNVDLWEQYPNIQREQPATWTAFLRRIHRVVKFFSDGRQAEYTLQEYMTGFVEVDSTETKDLPFYRG